MDFYNILTKWYLQHHRELPWRATRDPYAIWLSEIILQQTRVAQGQPYFESFLKAFPDVICLADADEQTVLRLWQGLGYYSRARNLHATAKHVAYHLNGTFPDSYRKLLELKGVGTYTAAAIASFAYGERVPVVDGNVFRVLSRYFGIHTDIGSGAAKAEFTALALAVMGDDPALFNQSIMEFGALQCTPKNPNCERCPLQSSCYALQHRMVDRLPVKLKKTKVRTRFLNYIIYRDPNNQTMIRQRTGNDIWKNLYEFPLIETETELSEVTPQLLEEPQTSFGREPHRVVHKLSHQVLHISFWQIPVDQLPEHAVSVDKLHEYPFPIALHNFIERHLR